MSEINCKYENEIVGRFYLELFSDCRDGISIREKRIRKFMKLIYLDLIEEPEIIGIKKIDASLVEKDENFSKNTEFKKVQNKVMKPVSEFLKFIYTVLTEGRMKYGDVVFSDKILTDFMKTQKSIKRKMLEYLRHMGIAIIVNVEDNDKWALCDTNKENILEDLRRFALQCRTTGEERYKKSTNMGMYLFLSGRFNVVNNNEELSNIKVFNNILGEEEFEKIKFVNKKLMNAGCTVEYLFEPHVNSFEIRYMNKRIKTNPFCSLIADYKRENRFLLSVKFPALKRILPMIYKQNIVVQKEFLKRGIKCSSCGWCDKKNEVMKPTVLQVDGVKKILCWYMDIQFDDFNEQEMEYIHGFIDAHILMGKS